MAYNEPNFTQKLLERKEEIITKFYINVFYSSAIFLIAWIIISLLCFITSIGSYLTSFIVAFSLSVVVLLISMLVTFSEILDKIKMRRYY